jgi:hypothetical protein
MVCQIGMGYGVWESLVHLAGNRLGGHEKVWVTGGYGLLEVWVKTEATVIVNTCTIKKQFGILKTLIIKCSK